MNEGGVKFDKHISIGHLLTTLVVVAGVITGYARLESLSLQNQERINTLEQKQAADREFHINQRVRLWSRLNEFEAEIVTMREAIAELRAGQNHMIRQQDRMLEKLDTISP